MITVVVGLLGGSTVSGTAPPLGGPAIPASVTYHKNGGLQSVLNAWNSGPQSGLFTCLDAHGYQVTVVERSAAGTNASNLQVGLTPLLISDLAALGLAPDVVLISHGGNDARSQTYATNYGNRVFGPWNELGKHSPDISVFGRLRSAYGSELPIVVSTLPNHNGLDLLRGAPESGDVHWHEAVRAQQVYGCYRDQSCYLQISDPAVVTLDPVDGHPDSAGYYNLGWMLCQTIILQVGL